MPLSQLRDPTPMASVGQLLVLQQNQQIAALIEQNAALLDQCKSLSFHNAAAMASVGRGGGRTPPNDPERTRLRGLTLREFCRQCYWPERNHKPKGPTAELSGELLARLAECFGRELLVKELSVGTLRHFRSWLERKVAGGMSPATANIRLRQLRAIWNHAARWHWPDTGRKWRIVKRPPPMQFFTEVETEVNAWTIAQLAAIEEQARKQVGHVGTSLANVFWTALHLLFSRIASRETATLLARREDYNPEARTIRLRAETQKQRQDQSFVLPQGVATAIDRLLASHDHPLIFGCWPYDPPVKSTGRRKWRVLENHWKKRLVFPAGLSLQKGVGLRQYRRSGATICDENGGNAQELLGHSSPKTTERHYKDRKRKRACRQSLFIPDASPQQLLF